MDSRWLRRVIEEIDKFDVRCQNEQSTDTAATWLLLSWIRDTAAMVLSETEHPRPARIHDGELAGDAQRSHDHASRR